MQTNHFAMLSVSLAVVMLASSARGATSDVCNLLAPGPRTMITHTEDQGSLIESEVTRTDPPGQIQWASAVASTQTLVKLESRSPNCNEVTPEVRCVPSPTTGQPPTCVPVMPNCATGSETAKANVYGIARVVISSSADSAAQSSAMSQAQDQALRNSRRWPSRSRCHRRGLAS